MKKNIILIIFGIIIGGLIFGSIVYAYTYSARDINFIPTDNSWNVHNVETALESLKNYKESEYQERVAQLQQEYSKYDKCKFVTFTQSSAATTSTGQSVYIGFRVSKFIDFLTYNGTGRWADYWTGGTNFISASGDSIRLSDYWTIDDNNITLKNGYSSDTGQVHNMMVCE